MRKRLRLRRYDYSAAGAYFVTLCVAGRACVLGRVAASRVLLTSLGQIATEQLTSLPERFDVEVDCFVVMPNHVHAVVFLHDDGLALGTVVGAFKAGSAREINVVRRTTGAQVWQRGYFDHVVRDHKDLDGVRDYIATNPLRWMLACEGESGQARPPRRDSDGSVDA